jgi:protein-disulfide isomerase
MRGRFGPGVLRGIAVTVAACALAACGDEEKGRAGDDGVLAAAASEAGRVTATTPETRSLAGGASPPRRAPNPEWEPNARGPRDAPVTVVEFSDFECPYSRRARADVEAALAPYGDRVRWVFKSFPLPFHPHARLAHQAALAAGEWDLFWEMRERIFAAAEPLTREALVRLGAQAGIPADDFAQVLDSAYFEAAVEQELEEGRALGVRGTPTFFVNGRRFAGAPPREALDYLVRRALSLPAKLPASAPAELLASDPEEGHPLGFGDPRSRVLKLFVDLRSPLGARARPLVEGILRRHGPRLRIIVKSRPLGIDADGALAHQAAIALAKRGADFLEMWRRTLAAPRGGVTVDAARGWAEAIGLDAAAAAEVAVELARGEHRSVIDSDLAQAVRLGVRGAPAALFLGLRFEGLEGLERLLRALDEEAGATRPALPSGAQAAVAEESSEALCDEKRVSSAAGAPAGTPAEPLAPLLARSFGVAAQGSLVEHRFEVPNDGTEPLSLRVVYAPPTVEVSLPREPTAPGATAAVLVRLWTAGAGEVAVPIVLAPEGGDGAADHRGRGQPGAYRRLLLSGRLNDAVGVEPLSGLRIEAQVGATGRALAVVTSRDGRLSGLEVARKEPADLEVAVEKPAGTPGWFEVRVTAPPRRAPGRERGLVLLAATHPEVPAITVSVEIAVHDEIVVTPAALRLGGTPSGGSGRERAWLRLRRADGGLLAIRSAHATVAGVRVVPDQAPSEVEHRLYIQSSAASPPGALRGEIVIEAVLTPEKAGSARTVRVPLSD